MSKHDETLLEITKSIIKIIDNCVDTKIKESRDFEEMLVMVLSTIEGHFNRAQQIKEDYEKNALNINTVESEGCYRGLLQLIEELRCYPEIVSFCKENDCLT